MNSTSNNPYNNKLKPTNNPKSPNQLDQQMSKILSRVQQKQKSTSTIPSPNPRPKPTKQQVSMSQVLKFLNYLNQNTQQAFNQQQIQINNQIKLNIIQDQNIDNRIKGHNIYKNYNFYNQNKGKGKFSLNQNDKDQIIMIGDKEFTKTNPNKKRSKNVERDEEMEDGGYNQVQMNNDNTYVPTRDKDKQDHQFRKNQNNKDKETGSDYNRGGTMNSNNNDDQFAQDAVNQSKKKLNQNRAIKRIIQTAFSILQKNYRYGQSATQYQYQNNIDDEKSTSTQFNIYMKQYNRIIEQINTKQLQQIQKINKLYQDNQQQLQQVFQYTVVDDFRQKLKVFSTKDKITKQNIQGVIDRFKDGLVILKPEGLKIQILQNDEVINVSQRGGNSRLNNHSKYNTKTKQQQPSSNPFSVFMNFAKSKQKQNTLSPSQNLIQQQQPNTKSIKITQIQNVQYYTQPYIFIALSINKDKTKSRQYLYIRFTSQQNQDKWDRALYCCYMSKKMNKKSKLFQIQFPVQDVMKKQKQQHVKQDQNYYIKDDDEKGVIQMCFGRKYMQEQLRDITKRATIGGQATQPYNNNQDNLLTDRSQITNRMMNKRNLTDQKYSIISNNQHNSLNNDQINNKNKINTTQNKNNKYQNPFKNIQIKNSINQNEQEEINNNNNNVNRKNTIGSNQYKKKNTIFNNTPEYQQDSNGALSKKSTLKYQQKDSNNVNTNNNNINPFMRLLKIAQQQQNTKQKTQSNSNLATNKNIQPPLKQYQQIPNQQQKIKKLKRLRQLQKNNIRGIVCQKQKFFMNKQKIIFFGDQSMNQLSKIDSRVNSPIGGKQKQNNIITNRKQLNQQQLSQIQQLSSRYFQYFDYDYKKDIKSQRKIIHISNINNMEIIPSVTQATTTLVIHYNEYKDKLMGKEIIQKELKLLFGNNTNTVINSTKDIQIQNKNPSISKAYQIHEWIMLIKDLVM